MFCGCGRKKKKKRGAKRTGSDEDDAPYSPAPKPEMREKQRQAEDPGAVAATRRSRSVLTSSGSVENGWQVSDIDLVGSRTDEDASVLETSTAEQFGGVLKEVGLSLSCDELDADDDVTPNNDVTSAPASPPTDVMTARTISLSRDELDKPEVKKSVVEGSEGEGKEAEATKGESLEEDVQEEMEGARHFLEKGSPTNSEGGKKIPSNPRSDATPNERRVTERQESTTHVPPSQPLTLDVSTPLMTSPASQQVFMTPQRQQSAESQVRAASTPALVDFRSRMSPIGRIKSPLLMRESTPLRGARSPSTPKSPSASMTSPPAATSSPRMRAASDQVAPRTNVSLSSSNSFLISNNSMPPSLLPAHVDVFHAEM